MTIHQGAGDLLTAAIDNPIERLARNFHSFRGLGVVKTLAIGEPHGFELVGPELDLAKIA